MTVSPTIAPTSSSVPRMSPSAVITGPSVRASWPGPQVLDALREMLRLAEQGALPLDQDQESGVLTAVVHHGGLLCRLMIDDGEPDVVLSPRELQVAHLVARGATNRMIASRLEISTWTVATHVRRIFAKLRVNSRAEMVAQLVRSAPPSRMPE